MSNIKEEDIFNEEHFNPNDFTQKELIKYLYREIKGMREELHGLNESIKNGIKDLEKSTNIKINDNKLEIESKVTLLSDKVDRLDLRIQEQEKKQVRDDVRFGVASLIIILILGAIINKLFEFI